MNQTLRERFLVIQARAKEAANKPTLCSIELPTLLNWIISPNEEVGDFGLLTHRLIHKQLAEWLERQPSFHSLCVIEYCEDGDILLWRRKDWLSRVTVEVARAEHDLHDTVQRIERRERFDRSLKRLIEFNPVYKSNLGLAKQTITLSISQAEKGDERAKAFLNLLDYYNSLD